MSDQIVDVDLARHVPIHDLRHIGTSPRAPEFGSLPHASGHELEWTRLDFLTGAGDSDDHRDSPTAMAAFEGLAHNVHIADALEAVIGAATRQLDQVGNQIALHLLRVDKVSDAKFP